MISDVFQVPLKYLLKKREIVSSPMQYIRDEDRLITRRPILMIRIQVRFQ